MGKQLMHFRNAIKKICGLCMTVGLLQVLTVSIVFGAAAIQLNYSGKIPSGDIDTLSKSMSNANIRNEEWSTDYQQKFLILPFDDLNIPVVHASEVIYSSPTKGYAVFSSSGVRMVTSTSLVKTEAVASSVTYQRRPTLFVTMCGSDLKDSNIFDGNGNCAWQSDSKTETQDFSSQIADYYNKLSKENKHQFHHMIVDWDSNALNINQVKDLAGRIKSFLSAKKSAWDVVLIGHSRGGIFAHELATWLAGSQKIDKLHVFLLDPTASSLLTDAYPVELPRGNKIYGNLFFDGKPFAGFADVTTTGDMPVTGYNNYGREDHEKWGSTHVSIPWDWLKTTTTWGFTRAMDDILRLKDVATFNQDGPAGETTIERISRAEDIQFIGDVYVENGSLFVSGYITLGGVYGSTVGLSASVGKDGVELFSSFAVAVTYLSLRSDSLYYSKNTALGNISASLSKRGIYSSLGATTFGGGVSLTEDKFTLSVNVLGWDEELKIDTEDLVTGGVISGLEKTGRAIKRKARKLGIKW